MATSIGSYLFPIPPPLGFRIGEKNHQEDHNSEGSPAVETSPRISGNNPFLVEGATIEDDLKNDELGDGNNGVRCGVADETENLGDTRSMLQIMLEWMALDRTEKRVEKAERRKSFERLTARLDQLEALVTEQLTTQTRIQSALRDIKNDHKSLQQEMRTINNTLLLSTPKEPSANRDIDHTQRIEILRDEIRRSSLGGPSSINNVRATDASTMRKPREPRLSDLPSLPQQPMFDETYPVNDEIQDSPNEPRINLQLMQFDGESPWESYCVHLETVTEANRWTEDVCRRHVAANFRGKALEFFQTLDRDIQHNFRRLVKSFKRRFGDKQTTGVAQTKFRNRHQKVNESLEEFAADIQRLARAAHPSWPPNVVSELCLTQFLDGISDIDLQCVVRDREPQNLDEALDLAEKLETNRKTARTTRKLAVRTADVSQTLASPQTDNQKLWNSGNDSEST